MGKIIVGTSLTFLALAIAAPAHAGKGGPAPITTVTQQSRKDNKVFVGINWNFGVRTGATAVVGYRWAKVNSSDRVRGALVDLTFVLTGAPAGVGEFHIKGLAGSRSAQGELGVGYGFQGEAFLLNGGVRAPYVNVGTDYLLGKGWQPYIGVDTLRRVKAREGSSTTTCPAGYELSNGVCVLID